MPPTVEIFADVTCPFTHVGLRLVADRLTQLGAVCRVRAWPLEWVNGEPLAGDAVAHKVEVLRGRLGEDCFTGFDASSFPATSIPALNLTAAAYERGAEPGFAMARELRDALFERGLDIGDAEVLARIAREHGLEPPDTAVSPAVQSGYDEGRRRGVQGSPDFFVGDDRFFCPSLDIGHDDAGELVADLDIEGLSAFLEAVGADEAAG